MKTTTFFLLVLAFAATSCSVTRNVREQACPFGESVYSDMLQSVADGFYDGDTSRVPRDAPVFNMK